MRGQLLGLRPGVPWAAPIRLRVTGRVEGERFEETEEIQVDAVGSFPIPLSPRARRAERFELRLEADDPWHLPVHLETGAAVRTRTAPLGVHVQPIGVVTGKVVDARGEPVPAARLCVFPMTDTGVAARQHAATNSAADGNFTLRVPAAATFLVVAIPMREASLSGMRFTMRDGAIADCNVARDDLLPASLTATTGFGSSSDLPPLTLEDSVLVEGIVVDSLSRPVPGVPVRWTPRRTRHSPLRAEPIELWWWSDGTLDRTALATTDTEGRFRLPARPLRIGTLEVVDSGGRPEPFVEARAGAAPWQTVVRVDRTTLRAERDGIPASGVALAWMHNSIDLRTTDEHGELEVPYSPGKIIAATIHSPGDAPFIFEFDPTQFADGRGTIELPPRNDVPVAVDFDGGIPVRQVVMEWHRLDAETTPIRVALRHDSQGGPFQFRVPEGRYRVDVSAPRQAERRDTFILAASHEIVVGPRGRDCELPIAHGGRIRIEITDSRGVLVDGAVAVEGIDGSATTLELRDGTGESINLATGSYQIRTPGDPSAPRIVDVSLMEVTSLRIELPR